LATGSSEEITIFWTGGTDDSKSAIRKGFRIAPSALHASSTSMFSFADIIKTGMCFVRGELFNSLQTETPLPSGNRTSRMTKSGRSTFICRLNAAMVLNTRASLPRLTNEILGQLADVKIIFNNVYDLFHDRHFWSALFPTGF